MDIERDNVYLLEKNDYSSKHYDEKEAFKYFLSTITYYTNLIETLLSEDLKKLSNEEYYELINKVYDVKLDENDYLKAMSVKNKIKYNRLINIWTYMTFNDIYREGHGKDFSYWNQLYQVGYLAFAIEDNNINNESILTKEEINKLIQDKSIVLIKRKSRTIHEKLDYNESLERIPIENLNCDITDRYVPRIEGTICNDDNFNYFITILRKRLTKKKILQDMKIYLQELQDDIYMFLSFSKYKQDYNKWYDESIEKVKVNSLQNKIIGR